MSKPNIILITTDQQRFDTICVLGNNHIFTPHLNWLVDQGITFTRCYTDSPVCMAARATIMTGKHGYTTGLVRNSDIIRPMATNATLPGILTKSGYQTRAQGKMHFSPMRANYGFEHIELIMHYYREKNKNVQLGLPKAHGVGENEMVPVISTVDEINSLTYWTVRRSIDFLETRDDTRPFFLWTSFAKPHPPFDPCVNYWNLYRDREVPEPVCGDWSETLDMVPKGYLERTYCLNNVYRLSKEQMKDVKRAYYACITQIDYNLGLLFSRMREMQLLENTWIIFTSDHGDMMGDHHLGAKGVFLEGSAHIPLIIMPPIGTMVSKQLAGKRCNFLASLSDIMPTILNISEVEVPGDVDGVDLLKRVDNTEDNRILFGNFANVYFAVVESDYKYMWTVLGGVELLFNLKDDPKEQQNLAVKREEQTKLLSMREKLIEHLKGQESELVKDGKLVYKEAPRGPQDVNKYPGFHSTTVPDDSLH